mgnify:CR=1 FL=1
MLTRPTPKSRVLHRLQRYLLAAIGPGFSLFDVQTGALKPCEA